MSNTGRERDAEARDSKSQQPLYSQNEIMSVKSKWVNMQNTRKNLQNESTYLPEFDLDDDTWLNCPSMNLPQVESGKSMKHVSVAPESGNYQWGNLGELEATPASMAMDHRQGNAGPAGLDGSLPTGNFHEDELESWLQYPAEETSDAFFKEDHAQQGPSRVVAKQEKVEILQQPSSCRPGQSSKPSIAPPAPVNQTHSQQGPSGTAAPSQRAANAAMALALGAKRAAGLIPSRGSEAFSKIRTTSLPSIPVTEPCRQQDLDVLDERFLRSLAQAKKPPVASNMVNFSMFARPATLLSKGSNTTSSTQPPVNGYYEMERQPGYPALDYLPMFREREKMMLDHQQSLERTRSSAQGTSALTLADNSMADSEVRALTPLYRKSSIETTMTSSAAESQDTQVDLVGQAGLQVGSHEKNQKKRERDEDDILDVDNGEDLPEDSQDNQKSGGRKHNVSKRSRAAAIHNMSERRRRDRINERMKMLQELIPNSNKTDKASMLDEAIEYLKMLQMQLQVMSMRSGISVSPLLPSPMVSSQVAPSHMPAMPMSRSMGPVGVGLGMPPSPMGYPDVPGVPMAMAGPSSMFPELHHGRILEMNPSARTSQPNHPMGRMSSMSPSISSFSHRQLNPSQVDPLAMYLARQEQQLQADMVNQNMDRYQAYLLDQQRKDSGNDEMMYRR